ncbi:MAG: peptidase inhibitor family I36 protein [Actinobacteria bacterium]|nr:peptidase inhibitor family I36 protein [Actinomycetota bacterium]
MWKMRFTWVRVLSVAALIGVLPVVGPQAASAHEAGWAFCPYGALCAYWDSHYSGNRYQFFGTNSSWHSWGIADDDSSSRNNGTTGMRARIWEHTNYGGRQIVCLPKGTRVAHHSPNDKGSSNDWQWFC